MLERAVRTVETLPSYILCYFLKIWNIGKELTEVAKKVRMTYGACVVLRFAGVAELADAHGSGPCESNFMGVQVSQGAP